MFGAGCKLGWAGERVVVVAVLVVVVVVEVNSCRLHSRALEGLSDRHYRLIHTRKKSTVTSTVPGSTRKIKRDAG